MKKQERSSNRSKYHPKPVAADQSEESDNESLDDLNENASKTKSYRKRTVESNWNRYEEDLDPNSEANRFAIKQETSTTFNLNFNDLLANSCKFFLDF